MTAQLPPSDRSVDIEAIGGWAYSAAFSDACDAAGLRQQAPVIALHPVAAESRPVVGWARPAVAVTVDFLPDQPYQGEISFLDSLRPGEVPLVAASTRVPGLWGELFSAAAKARGATGAIIAGSVRDQERIRQVGFTVYHTSAHPTDCHGRTVLEPREQIDIEGVSIGVGDLVVVDVDGLVVIPSSHVPEIVSAARAKVTAERSALAMLEQGSLLREAWQAYGVL